MRLKPNTQVRVRGVLRSHILSTLGKMPLAAVERSHAIDLQQKLCAHPVTANKAVKVLSHMYRLGEGWGLVPEGCNPCRSVEKYPERRRERFLTDAEFARLGQPGRNDGAIRPPGGRLRAAGRHPDFGQHRGRCTRRGLAAGVEGTPESASASPARSAPYNSETVRHAALSDNVLKRSSIALNAAIACPPNSWVAAY